MDRESDSPEKPKALESTAKRWSACWLALVGTLLSGAVSVQAQRILYVNQQASGANDGTSWANAYRDLQNALAAAVSGDEVWVALGTYYPGLAGNRTATFQLKNGVGLFGGFAGSETNRNQRDPSLHETILSGDLSQNDQPDFGNYLENSYHVVTARTTDATAVLDGFVIQGGNASGTTTANNSGAGLKIDHASPTIANCVFRANVGRVAGGLLNLASSPVLMNCLFNNNRAQSSFGRGGAIYNTAGSQPVLLDCWFVTNSATGGASGMSGGAVYIEANCAVTFVGCTFAFNQAATSEPNTASGGAVLNQSGAVTFNRCAFWNNSSGNGGAVWSGSTNAQFLHCALGGNIATLGGALLNFLGVATLMGCTLARNRADDGAGVANDFNGHSAFTNCILWTNISANATTALQGQVHNQDGGTFAIASSCVQGLFVQQPGQPPPTPDDFPGSLDADPRLRDPKTQRLTLTLGSPCIDAADNSAFPAEATTDARGLPRFVDEPWTLDTGAGSAPIADMGAYEYQGVFPEQISNLTASLETVNGTAYFNSIYTIDRKLTGVTLRMEATPGLAPPSWLQTEVDFQTIEEDELMRTVKARSRVTGDTTRFFRLVASRAGGQSDALPAFGGDLLPLTQQQKSRP